MQRKPSARSRRHSFGLKSLLRQRQRTLKTAVKNAHAATVSELRERTLKAETLRAERDQAEQQFNDLARACRTSFDLARESDLRQKALDRALRRLIRAC